MILQQDKPDDYIVATRRNPLQEFLEIAFAHVQLDWKDYAVSMMAATSVQQRSIS